MNAATHKVEGNAKAPMLYMAPALQRRIYRLSSTDVRPFPRPGPPVFFDSWRKYRAGEALSGLEPVALQVILLHPEYHALFDAPERHLDRDSIRSARNSTSLLASCAISWM